MVFYLKNYQVQCASLLLICIMTNLRALYYVFFAVCEERLFLYATAENKGFRFSSLTLFWFDALNLWFTFTALWFALSWNFHFWIWPIPSYLLVLTSLLSIYVGMFVFRTKVSIRDYHLTLGKARHVGHPSSTTLSFTEFFIFYFLGGSRPIINKYTVTYTFFFFFFKTSKLILFLGYVWMSLILLKLKTYY